MAAGDYTLNVGHLTGLGGFSREANDVAPLARPGTVSFSVDALGFRIFKYIRAIAALTKGQLAQMTGTGVTPIQTITNTAALTTGFAVAGMTAQDHQGKIAYVLDGTAGAAPEGEFSIVAGNTTTAGTFEPELPLSAALANNHTVTLIATYQAEVGSATVLGQHTQGICIANGGVSAGNYGWAQQYGMSPYINVGTPTTVASRPLIAAATGALDMGTTVFAADAGLSVAINWVVTTDDQATPRGICKLHIFSQTHATTT